MLIFMGYHTAAIKGKCQYLIWSYRQQQFFRHHRHQLRLNPAQAILKDIYTTTYLTDKRAHHLFPVNHDLTPYTNGPSNINAKTRNSVWVLPIIS